ncbi:SDR family oxidoreductase [Lactobacillus sp. ESL0731]|uniref:SDR family oxidoreductase n=1 Tax=unclassified Lactobacillus TaxID=2620435 RepID=UPI0023F9619F|nr:MULTISPECIES: SDR family oxidoreductase [unclassified Lactobacillus]WEV50899.1 SDR family oxidoreductase [Lactobacillus sp. ESL0700]WEV62030.1 SDR family oxidoreductase [Lactobacillus sp. ESL0731]
MAIKNKVVIITGASSGIGEATAKLLAQKGAKVVLAARREAKLQALTAEISAAGGRASYQVTDVTSENDNQKLVQLALAKYGQVDVMFLNAGLMPSSRLSALKTTEWNKMIDVNLKGVLNGLAAVLPQFNKQKSGQIIATSSVAGVKPYLNAGVYGATKYAVRDLMSVLRMESATDRANIRTTTIYPAAIQTELLNTISDEQAAKALHQTYNNYQISPERIANIVAFAIDQPEDTNIGDITVGATTQPW